MLSHVHSIVMSSNSMVGHLPVDLQQLTQLRMVELATMTGTYIRALLMMVMMIMMIMVMVMIKSVINSLLLI